VPHPGEARPADQLRARRAWGVHHAFAIAHDEYETALDHLRAYGVEITFEEDRRGGVVNGPRAYFTIPTARCWSSSI
jgi:hypothetical protein